MTAFEKFRSLHEASEPLLLGNCWDSNSAAILIENGFTALATSSGAVARSMGYEDGEHIPFSLLLETVKRIKKQTSLPLSVDIEKGFSANPEGIWKNIEILFEMGVAGINLEDSSASKPGELQDVIVFENIISYIANQLVKTNRQLFLNIRTDGFLLKLPNAISETLARITRYEQAGAAGIFVPFIKEEQDISTVVKATRLPVNVLAMPGLPGIATLSRLGVKRVSMGTALFNALNREMDERLKKIRTSQSFDSLF